MFYEPAHVALWSSLGVLAGVGLGVLAWRLWKSEKTLPQVLASFAIGPSAGLIAFSAMFLYLALQQGLGSHVASDHPAPAVRRAAPPAPAAAAPSEPSAEVDLSAFDLDADDVHDDLAAPAEPWPRAEASSSDDGEGGVAGRLAGL